MFSVGGCHLREPFCAVSVGGRRSRRRMVIISDGDVGGVGTFLPAGDGHRRGNEPTNGLPPPSLGPGLLRPPKAEPEPSTPACLSPFIHPTPINQAVNQSQIPADHKSTPGSPFLPRPTPQLYWLSTGRLAVHRIGFQEHKPPQLDGLQAMLRRLSNLTEICRTMSMRDGPSSSQCWPGHL